MKACLRGESPPFSADLLEGMASLVNMQVRAVRRLSSSSLRYWMIEFLRRQPRGKKYRALILKFIKGRIAALLLVEARTFSSYFAINSYKTPTIMIDLDFGFQEM